MGISSINREYRLWLRGFKSKIQASQIKAALSVNRQLIALYWELGKTIAEKQTVHQWGSGLVDRLAHDLATEFPDMGGFSRRNLYSMKRFYLFYKEEVEIVQQVVAQFDSDDVSLLGSIPWGHHVLILAKVKKTKDALFYIKETISNNWSRNVLTMQIQSGLHRRNGKALNNFGRTLPKAQSDLASQLFKDPYMFNFLTLEKEVRESELEKQLTENITRFLLELGKGFAYMGKQYLLKVGRREYRLDLLFYHVKLRAYVVIELKTGDFEPEYIGKLNFYLSAVDEFVKGKTDKPSIGMLLCSTKDKLNVEFALRDINKPIGVSEYRFGKLPKRMQSEMPTLEEWEREVFSRTPERDGPAKQKARLPKTRKRSSKK